MKIVVFGLSVSSSWGNGHATLWRGLSRALHERGHHVVFFERDVPYYASHRDLFELPGGDLVLYSEFDHVRSRARAELLGADAAIVTSYCPDGVAATEMVLDASRPVRVFYDLDTPVTLAELEAGRRPAYIGDGGLGGFELVLSFTGGPALELIRSRLGARRVAPLYGFVDPAVHRRVPAAEEFRCELSYLGTYAADRHASVEELFLEPARLAPERSFLLGGSMYPESESFPENVRHRSHVPPGQHAAFFSSSRLTLNVTRSTMARLGYCPSGRLFEAACCGTPIVSDWFDGLDGFFDPASEIFVVRTRTDVLDALAADASELARRAERARERALQEHTALCRAEHLEALLGSVREHHRDMDSRPVEARVHSPA